MTRDVVKKFFYTLSLNELNLMNHNQLCPDVSYNTLLYLDLIYFIPDCTASKIAQQLHISKPAVTSKINDMIAQGLVKKVQSQKDKRVYYLTFNDQVPKLMKIITAAFVVRFLLQSRNFLRKKSMFSAAYWKKSEKNIWRT